MSWLNNGPADSFETRKRSFVGLVLGVPAIRGWFGLSIRRVSQTAHGWLQAKSIAGSIFLALSVGIGDWLQMVLETRQSLFLVPPIPKGNRWVEHIRNTYRDYGMDPTVYNWTKLSSETPGAYEARLEAYASNLVDVFRKQGITMEALKSGLTKLLPAGATVTITEPWTLLKTWPGPKQYQATPLPSEMAPGSHAYLDRLQVYTDQLAAKKLLPYNTPGAWPNCYYPLPADAPVKSGTYDESTNGVLAQRVSLLKSGLGSYTNLDGVVSRRWPSSRNQGGRLEIVLSQDTQDPNGVEKRLQTLKAAGVYCLVTVPQFIGVAPTVADQTPELRQTDATVLESFVGEAASQPVLGLFQSDV